MSPASDSTPHDTPPAIGAASLPPPGAHLHLVGICGAGMAPLALALRAGGWRVSGEDRLWPEEGAALLQAAGVGQSATGELPAGTQQVIYSSAIGVAHPTRVAAHGRGVAGLRRGEALAALVRGRRLIAIVGSHGKTTTSAMLITALNAAGSRAGGCDYLLGGLFADGRTPPARWTGAEWVIAEVDESDGTIADFTPEVTLCVNVDWDHCDRYRDPAAIEAAFAALAARTRRAVFFNAGCAWSRRVFPAAGGSATVFGFGSGGDYELAGVSEITTTGQTLRLGGRFGAGSVKLAAVGAFNATNATGALAVAAWLGDETVERRLADYPGVRRRQAVLRARTGVSMFEDYAHHPTEIAALLEAVRAMTPARLMVVFQPHRFTRTAQFKAEFARVLAGADQLFLLNVYAASEVPVAGGTAADLLAELRARSDAPPAELLTDAAVASRRLAAEARAGDVWWFVGAGDIDAVARQMSAWLSTMSPGCAGFLDTLRDRLDPETNLRVAEPLGPKTTIRVGGVAEIYAEPANTADLQTLLAAAHAAHLPVLLLGRGSNLVVADEGVRGVVIRLQHAHWRRFVCLGPGRYWAGAGLRLRELCGTACKLGEGGFEFLEGIPGTVGGALRMNAGAMGGWMYETVEQVHFLGLDGTLHVRPREALHVDYRRCQELESAIALGAVLRARGSADTAAIRHRLTELQTHRQASQPREPSAGCIFKNPPGDSAGRIIDELGLKGLRVGDAEVSATHANFIINRGHATGSDVIALVRRVRDEVRARRRIELEPEVMLCGSNWQEVLR